MFVSKMTLTFIRENGTGNKCSVLLMIVMNEESELSWEQIKQAAIRLFLPIRGIF